MTSSRTALRKYGQAAGYVIEALGKSDPAAALRSPEPVSANAGDHGAASAAKFQPIDAARMSVHGSRPLPAEGMITPTTSRVSRNSVEQDKVLARRYMPRPLRSWIPSKVSNVFAFYYLGSTAPRVKAILEAELANGTCESDTQNHS